ncbi:copper homeostasis protein CutC [Shinella sp. 838]|jgi:copper homeostasis protein|uniref:copper homeostasis protein CutC n=1 Tax=unclassified Shinella TaxID=2643062 RepID=UPI0003C550EC|nr:MULTISPECIES: copper homeostasis protein CutC [unclassified Shinella]EYR77776.1 copper homeostasis protein CutC [Shinella sp. DD12]MCA0343725.1 copper homeostasis protein CutC [Pseudomonadota bacterium]MDG4670444.1 copper homeostasis protein CutC [Shinella sp. 838]
MAKPLIELCVEGIDGFLAAQDAGADRVELCASLVEGGLTPSLATIRAAVKAAKIPVHVIIRPRGGDFLYSETEFETMVEDIAALRGEGVSGVVIGCLTPDGRIDEARTKRLVEAARPMSVTCHRAFDMTADAGEALEALIRCGVDRVLTSGQRDTALEGLAILKTANEQAAGRIVIMGCGALDADTIRAVRDGAGLVELHFAALKTVPSGMAFRNPHVGMGGTEKDREYEVTLTDRDAVRATIAAAKS